MSALNTSLYAALASSEAVRTLAPQLRGQEDIVAAQLRSTLQAEPGTTVTARYQFRVGPDGSYQPTETHITTERVDSALEKEQGQKRSGQRSAQQGRDRQSKFSDFTPVRPLLSPSDELALFSVTGSDAGRLQVSGEAQPAGLTAASALLAGQATDEAGQSIEVDILPPANDNHAASGLAAKAQASVAGLYARNNDLVYNVTPLSELAA